MKNFISIIFILLLSQSAFAETYSFTARILTIEKDYIIVGNNEQKFMLVNKHSPAHIRIGSSFKTSYMTSKNSKTSFETLEAVGHITKAKVTIKDNLVKEIMVLEIHI